MCRECARLPKSERDQKERLSALWEMLCSQSNITPANRGTAAAWAAEGNPELQTLAQLVMDIGRVHPRKKKRLPFIQRNHPELWSRMIAADVVEDWWPSEGHEPEDYSEDEPVTERQLEPARAAQESEQEDESIPF
jgi:hypothetical protein